MQRIALIPLLVACSHPAPPAAPAPCPTVPVAEPSPATKSPAASPSALDDKTVIARAQALLRAMATGDSKAFADTTAPSFIEFGYGRTYNRERVIAYLERERARQMTRTCEDERVSSSALSAIYTATCTETYAAHDDVPGYKTEVYINLVFVPSGGDWKATFWSSQVGGVDGERDMWNDVFQQGMGFKKTANQHMIDAVKGHKPGKALDIAMGQGRNVLYLAAQGWKVTGVDISEAGIKLAKDAAAKQKLSFDAVVQDIDKYDLGKDKWDLVTLIYAGSDPKLIERIKPSIKKGGLFVVEFFAKETTAGTGIGGFAPGELAKQFTGWKIITDQIVEDVADWGLRKGKVARFTAERL